MSKPGRILDENLDIAQALSHMAEKLRPIVARDPVMVGIHTGGVWVARRLHELLNLQGPLGTLDISFYRDDFTKIGIHPEVKASELPMNIDERHVILCDDVLHTGRTIRAALNEIFDYGRPASVTLVVLVDRNGRELPIQADIIGHPVDLRKGEHIKLTSDSPDGLGRLALEIREVGE